MGRMHHMVLIRIPGGFLSNQIAEPKPVLAGFRQGFQVPPLKLGPPKHLGPPKYLLGGGPPNIFVPLENYKYRKSNSKRDNTIPNTCNEWFLGKLYAWKSCLNVF